MYASYGPCVRVVACGRQEWVSWRRNQQGTENRADDESGGLACSAASKNRADKELGRLILLYGKV
jgi:hypothetical protein